MYTEDLYDLPNDATDALQHVGLKVGDLELYLHSKVDNSRFDKNLETTLYTMSNGQQFYKDEDGYWAENKTYE